MFSSSALLLFIASSVLLILAPGPDIIFTVTQGITRGRKAGLFTAFGLSFGNAVHTLAAALGLSVIFKTSAWAFVILKTCGALYLFYLAWKAIKHRNDPVTVNAGDSPPKPGSLLLRGFFMNIMNPKVALFFLAFLPQFVNPGYGHVPLQMMVLGLIFMVLVALIFGAFGYFAGFFGAWILKKPGFAKVMNLAAATVFGGLGLKLLLAKR